MPGKLLLLVFLIIFLPYLIRTVPQITRGDGASKMRMRIFLVAVCICAFFLLRRLL